MSTKPTMRDLRVMTPFGATRPDGVTANRVPFDLSPVTAEMLVDALIAEGGEMVEVSVHGSQMLWRCRNCGGDHGGAGCDAPDLHDYDVYRITGDPKPGRYLVFPIPAEKETTT